MATTIRPIERRDHDDWLRLWRGYQAFYRVDIPAETSRVLWDRLHDPAEPIAGALAVEDNRAMGLVHHIRHRSTWTVGDYCYLQDLFVENAARGRGLGRKLIEHVYEAADAANCARVYWLTHETNADAMLLYDRIADKPGFVQYRKILRR